MKPRLIESPRLAIEFGGAQKFAPFGIQAQHPDEFVLHLIDLSPGMVAGAARDHRESLKNPPKAIEEYLVTLEAQGLTQTVSVLRECLL